MFEDLMTSTTSTSLSTLVPSILIALCLGLVVSFVYLKTEHNSSQGFATTLIMLPAVIAAIIMLVGTNVASAFSLAGAFSIIRFRSAQGSPKEITFILLSMAEGLSCGMGYLLFAAVMTVILCGVMVLIRFFQYGVSHVTSKTLKITIPENLDYQTAFQPILGKYTRKSDLLRVKTTDLGSLYEIEYAVLVKNSMNEKEFIDELRCRNGNLNITFILKPSTDDY